MKNFTVVNLILCAILAGLLWLSFVLEPRHDLRAHEYLPNMIYPVAAESFSGTEALPGGMVEQRPVAGSIARGQMPLHLEAGPEGAALAAATLRSPLSDTGEGGANEKDLARGRELFRTYCLLCHGSEGKGDGPVAKRGFPAPPSLLAPHALGLSDGQIFHIATFGQGNMPGHGAQIDPLDRWRIILRIRELQTPAREEATAATAVSLAVVAGDPERSTPQQRATQEQGEGQ